jgi:excisionase family DNA binding protein
MDTVLTDYEVAEVLKVKRDVIQAMARDGRIRAFKVGGAWRFEQSAINDYIQGNTRLVALPAPRIAGLNPKTAARMRRERATS